MTTVCLRLDPLQTRMWHLALLGRIESMPGMRAVCTFRAGGAPCRFAGPLLGLEALFRQREGGKQAVRVDAEAFARFAAPSPEADVTIDLAVSAAGSPGVWTLTADGNPGERGLWQAVLLGRCPLVEVRDGSRVIDAGRVGTEAKGHLAESLEDALARTITLILSALRGRTPGAPSQFRLEPPRMSLGAALGAATQVLSNRLFSPLAHLAYHTPHWRVGWRKFAGPDLIDLRQHPDGGWHDLADDGRRFYADPFPILHDETVTVFVEEFPYDTHRGVISAVTFGPDGPIGRPEPVLERPYHLSYPFVFERDGETWMIPETAEAGTVDLYRATRFPGGWVHEATLVDGLEAGDATLWETDGRWWMFATVRDGGAASDALHLWSAPDFRGPWTPHASNPVLIDIAGARPAGRMTMRDGALVRPVQDCRDGYGAALGLATITRLDDGGFMQRIDTIITPGPKWPGHGLHTVNKAGGFEFIDGSGRVGRFRRPRWSVGQPKTAARFA